MGGVSKGLLDFFLLVVWARKATERSTKEVILV